MDPTSRRDWQGSMILALGVSFPTIFWTISSLAYWYQDSNGCLIWYKTCNASFKWTGWSRKRLGLDFGWRRSTKIRNCSEMKMNNFISLMGHLPCYLIQKLSVKSSFFNYFEILFWTIRDQFMNNFYKVQRFWFVREHMYLYFWILDKEYPHLEFTGWFIRKSSANHVHGAKKNFNLPLLFTLSLH